MNQQKKQIILIVSGFVLVMSLILGVSLSGYGWLRVSAPAKTPGNAQVTIDVKADNEETKTITLKPGDSKRLRLKKGLWRAEARSGDVRAIDVVQVRGFRTTNLTTPDGEQRAIRQLGSTVNPCLVAPADQLYSYACGSGGGVVHHEVTKTRLSMNTAMFDGAQFGAMQPLKDGLIGFKNDDGTELEYLNLLAGTRQSVTLPAALKALAGGGGQPQLVSAGTGGSRFALISAVTNRVYIYDDPADAEPTEITPGSKVRFDNDGRLVSGHFANDTFVLYVGATTPDHGQEEGTVLNLSDQQPTPETHSTLPTYLFEYDKTGKETRRLDLGQGFDALSLQRLSGIFYVAERIDTTDFYRLVDGKLELVYSLNDVGSWAIVGGNAYLQADRSLYIFTPGVNNLFGLHSLYSSSDIFVSTIFSGNKRLIFTGYTGTGDEQQLNAYELLDTAQTVDTAALIEPGYHGFDVLIDKGLSADQVANLKHAFGLYAAGANIELQSLALSNVNAVPYGRYSDTTLRTILCRAKLNGTTELRVTIEYEGFTMVRLLLADKDDKPLYDSGPIDRSNVTL